ncbi:MAG: hypothetical protein U0103_16215 [Candidatus Obscuribacterales bacterium]
MLNFKMIKVLSVTAIALCAITPLLNCPADAQNSISTYGTGAASYGYTNNGGTQLAMVTPVVDPSNLRLTAQKNYQCSQFRVAQQLYSQVCQSAGVTADDYYWLGESYMHASMFSEASAAFQQGVRLNPASDSLNLGLVQSLIAAHQNTQAHDACLKAANTVTSPQARKQLEVMLKISSMPFPPAMQRDNRHSNHVER